MSIARTFREERVDFKLEHKPNWAGIVYGVCQIRKCPNFMRVGFYTFGFCKVCSTRSTPNLLTSSKKNKWVNRNWVRDLSHTLTAEQKREFYMTPEQKERLEDAVDYDPDKDEEEI